MTSISSIKLQDFQTWLARVSPQQALALAPAEPCSEKEFNGLVAEVYPQLLALAMSKTRNRPEAEDLAQETCLRAIRARLQFQRGTRFKAWIFTILTHQFFSSRRGKAVRQPEQLVESEHFAIPSPASSPEVIASSNEALAIISRLRPNWRDVVLCVVIDGMEYEEIAVRYGISAGTVKSRLWRARVSLREQLGESSWERAVW